MTEQPAYDAVRQAAGPGTSLDPAADPASPRPTRSAGRRRRSGVRVAGSTPYLLLAPAVVVVVAVLGYPLYKLVSLSFQKYNLPQLIAGRGEWVGLANYAEILEDSLFWTVLVRTLLFTAVTVGATIVLGTGIALLVQRSNKVIATAINVVLVAVWATPWLVSVALWQWMVDYEFGIANWLLTKIGIFGDFTNHNWFDNPVEGFAVIGLVVVWGALPFVVITLYAGMSQVPKELYEAAALDGAGMVASFRNVTWPALKPIYVILGSLSVIWNFQVFNQVWVMRGERPSSDYYLMSIYAFQESFRVNKYGYGSAIAVVMVLVLLVVSVFYVRQMVRVGQED